MLTYLFSKSSKKTNRKASLSKLKQLKKGFEVFTQDQDFDQVRDSVDHIQRKITFIIDHYEK